MGETRVQHEYYIIINMKITCRLSFSVILIYAVWNCQRQKDRIVKVVFKKGPPGGVQAKLWARQLGRNRVAHVVGRKRQ
jgi:hypothetical protein